MGATRMSVTHARGWRCVPAAWEGRRRSDGGEGGPGDEGANDTGLGFQNGESTDPQPSYIALKKRSTVADPVLRPGHPSNCRNPMGVSESSTSIEVDEKWSWTSRFVVASGVFVVGLALVGRIFGSQGGWAVAAHGLALGAFLICGGIAQEISGRHRRLKRTLWTAAFIFAGAALAVILLV